MAHQPSLWTVCIFPSLGPREHCRTPPCQPPAPGHQEPGPQAIAKAGPAPQACPSQVCGAVLSSLPAPTDGRAELPSITAISGQLPSWCPRQMAPLLPPSPSPPIYHPCQQLSRAIYSVSPAHRMWGGGRAEQHTERHPSSLSTSSLLHTAIERVPALVCVHVHVHRAIPSARQNSVSLILSKRDMVLPLPVACLSTSALALAP